MIKLLQKAMVNYLREHGWIVFYLDEQSRICRGDTCWLALYQEEERRKAM